MSVKINIIGDGLTYNTETSILKASQIIAFLNASSDMNINSEDREFKETPLIGNTYSNKSPRDALLSAGAKNNMQKILVFAKYHIEKSGKVSFTPQEIKDYFRKAGETEPRNYSRDVKEAIFLNYIYEDSNGEYAITDYGNHLLDSGFDIKVSKPLKKKNTPISSKKTSKAKASEEVMMLEIIPKIESIIPYHDIPIKGDRILWILYFAQQNSIAELSPADVEYMANRLVDDIPAKSLSALTERSRKKGFVVKTNEGKIKILFEGIEYLKNLQKQEEHIQEAEGM